MNRPFHKCTLCTVLFVLFICMTGQGVFADEAQVIFGVGWYDVGKAALEGRTGISRVTKGWKGMREINTVYYNPSEITIKEMEEALKKAGTFKETVNNEWTIITDIPVLPLN